ncbi:MAG: hypothetical protein V7L21_27090 [Nostoc sp.]|uniref:hypothetical protein n=1 Tax=Nostoc sp. TaxID=1180 RepID=UPI002FF8415C
MKVDAVRAKKSKYLPTVLTKDEVLAIIQKLSGLHQLLIGKLSLGQCILQGCIQTWLLGILVQDEYLHIRLVSQFGI